MKRSTLIGFIVLFSNIVPIASGQTIQQFQDLSNEITLLKRIIVEQDKRITELERVVKSLQGSTSTATNMTTNKTTSNLTGSASWKSSSNWDRLKDGMSESQVIAILGKPTSQEDLGPYRTLFYRGEVAGSGIVSGNVKLREDRVWLVNKPIF